MKYIIQVCIVAALFCACKSSTSSPPSAKDSTAAINADTALIGLYKGDFGGSNIYITINHAQHHHIAGYNIHKGLKRNMSGTYSDSTGTFEITLNEPGDHPFDGKFQLSMAADFNSATGTWTPLSKAGGKTKTFELKKVAEDQSDFKGYPLGADHRDITFETDGSVVLNYYDKITDSTFTQQMNTIRGTWERTGDSLVVNWEKRTDITLPATGYKLAFSGDDQERYLSSVTSTDSIEYWVGP